MSFNWSLNVLSVRLGDAGACFNLLFLQAVHQCLDLACGRWPVLVGCGSSDSSFSGSSCCYFHLLDLVSRGLPLVLAGAAWGSRGRSSWAELLAVGWLGKGWDRVSSLCPSLPCHLWAGEEHPSLAGNRGFLDGPPTAAQPSGQFRALAPEFLGAGEPGACGAERTAVGSCCGRVPIAGSSCRVPFLLAERGILRPWWEGDCLSWLFIFEEARRLSVLLVLAGSMLPEGPPWHPGGAGLHRRPFVPRWAGGQPGTDHLLLLGEGAQDTLPLPLPFSQAWGQRTLPPFPRLFRVLLWLSLLLFPVLTAVFCGADLGKMASATLPGSEARLSFCVLSRSVVFSSLQPVVCSTLYFSVREIKRSYFWFWLICDTSLVIEGWGGMGWDWVWPCLEPWETLCLLRVH